MNLSTDTIDVLKNFSNINQNLLVKPGKTVQTISTMKNILAEAEINEEFGSEFAIYDLPEFLRSIELFDSPKLNFNGGTNVAISEEGMIWSPVVTLEKTSQAENSDRSVEYSYPAVIQTQDGKIHITYTYHRKGVKHVILDPEHL